MAAPPGQASDSEEDDPPDPRACKAAMVEMYLLSSKTRPLTFARCCNVATHLISLLAEDAAISGTRSLTGENIDEIRLR